MISVIFKLKNSGYSIDDIGKLNVESFSNEFLYEANKRLIQIADDFSEKTEWELERISKSKEFVNEIFKSVKDYI